jgi:UDP-N-acetylglucosamine 3-dehydrogenase
MVEGANLTPQKIRVGILGCGAITRIEHLPAALAHPDVQLIALVDSDTNRAHALAQSRSVHCQISADFRPLLSQLDAVINALPNSLHAPVTLEILRAGVHVLCEKPLAIKAADALACAAMAEQRGLVLAAGMNRRFVASHKLMRLVLDEGTLGPLKSYSCDYGGVFDWKSASGFYFSKELAGGGAMIDFGVHLLDSLIDWFGPVSEFSYQDDNWGSGIEANAIMELRHSGHYGLVEGRLQASRTFLLKNRLLVRGCEAEAEVNIADLDSLIVRRAIGGEQVCQTLRLTDAKTSSFYKQLDNFVQSIRGTQEPEVNGTQAAVVLQLIEDAYANAGRIPEPWSAISSETPTQSTKVMA